KYHSKGASPLVNLGNAYARLDSLSAAMYYYQQALPVCDDYNLIGCYGNMGEMFVKKKDFKTALEYFHKAQEVAQKSGINTMDADLYKSMAEMYEIQQDYKAAYAYKEQYHQLKDSAF